MKKSPSKKIVLHRETLQRLEKLTLGEAAGGRVGSRQPGCDTLTGRKLGGCNCWI